MKPIVLIVLLVLSTLVAATTLFSFTARRLVLGWLGVGVIQSIFLLIIGFEFLALLNLLLVIASAPVLQLYSALLGTGAIHVSEKNRSLQDWIYGLGTGATVAGILAFALVSTFPETEVTGELDSGAFAHELLVSFPELPWILGLLFFLGIVGWATVGRPGWRPTSKERA